MKEKQGMNKTSSAYCHCVGGGTEQEIEILEEISPKNDHSYMCATICKAGREGRDVVLMINKESMSPVSFIVVSCDGKDVSPPLKT